MHALVPYHQEAGAGPGVVCLHSNASHSGQWRGLMQALASDFHVLAPDLYGAGRSPAWTLPRPLRLADEVALLQPVFARAAEPFVLVGHSYGAAVALLAAAMQPERVRALVLYEPTLFSLVDATSARPNDAEGIRSVVAHAGAAIDAGDNECAARIFIDYWMGDGAWDAMPDARKPAVAASMTPIRRWGHALFSERTPLAAFARLRFPVLYMTGARSPAAAHAVARVLVPALAHATHITFPRMGHMGPVTHADAVNTTIANFLVAHRRVHSVRGLAFSLAA